MQDILDSSCHNTQLSTAARELKLPSSTNDVLAEANTVVSDGDDGVERAQLYRLQHRRAGYHILHECDLLLRRAQRWAQCSMLFVHVQEV